VLAGAAKRYPDSPSANHDPTPTSPDLTFRNAPCFMIARGTMPDPTGSRRECDSAIDFGEGIHYIKADNPPDRGRADKVVSGQRG